ncbi:unconventional myosin-Ig-like, partial [Pteropus vampyrus]|uniref:Unconventional myosin-Ig-like n=1 Tax=Pteropus vampyrus TaxID=132908 RepID=A0A6P6C556_PTEVA
KGGQPVETEWPGARGPAALTPSAATRRYSVQGFMDKNRDALFQDFKRLLYNSTDPTLRAMWPDGQQDITEVTKRPLTAGTLFKNSMVALVENLASKEPFYVRCIKPNEDKVAAKLDEGHCRHQVAYLGLLENVRVRRAGFASRQPYPRFLLRYKMTCEYTWPNHLLGSDRAAVSALLEQHGLQGDVAFGHSKLFVRSPQTLVALEQSRARLIPIIVLLLQKVRRARPAGWGRRGPRAVYTIMRWFRRHKVRAHLAELHRRFQAARQPPLYGRDLVWPPPPAVLQPFQDTCQMLFCRWRARQLVKNIPPSDMAQIKAKVAAMGALQELRQDWGCRRAWARDYLSSVSVGAAGAGRRGGPQGRGLGLREHLLLSVRPRPCACSQAHPSSQTQIPLFRSAPSGPPAMTPQPWLPLALTWAGRVC